MKIFVAVFAAVLLAGLVLWGLIAHSADNQAQRDRFEKIALRSIDATKQLAIFAESRKPDDMAQAEASIVNLRTLEKNELLTEETRRQARYAADDYEAAIKRWR